MPVDPVFVPFVLLVDCAIAVRALRDADHTALQQPAQHDLGDRLAVRLADASEDLVAEEAVSCLLYTSCSTSAALSRTGPWTTWWKP